MTYGLFDPSIEQNYPKIWLMKPNKTVISRLSEIEHEAQLRVEFGKVNEISFTLPLFVERDNQNVRNKHVDLLKNKYLLKVEFMGKVEHFVIEGKGKEDQGAYGIPVTAYSLQYELNGKKIYEIEETSVTPDYLIDVLLDGTGWKRGYISPTIAQKHRSYNITNSSTTDGLHQIAEAIGAIIDFDTVKQEVNMIDENDASPFSGLMLNEKNYIESLQDSYNSETIVTRLYPIGSEGLTINSVNPTGTAYIEDFSFYLYPFERDKNRNVLNHSWYMTDELAHAMLDYQDKVKQKGAEIKSAFAVRDELNNQLLEQETILRERQLDRDIVEDRLDIMRGSGDYHYHKIGGNQTKTSRIKTGEYFGQYRTHGGTSTLTVDGQILTASSTWKTVKLSIDAEKDMPVTVGSADGVITEIFFAKMLTDEITLPDEQLRNKYNGLYHADMVAQQESVVKTKENAILSHEKVIDDLFNEISLQNNFTPEQLKERDRFTHEEYWVEENHIDAQELYDDALKQFVKINKPERSLSISIINFLHLLEEKRNWEKLKLGHRLRINHKTLDIQSESILVSIDYDFRQSSVSLTISDTKDMVSDEEKLSKLLNEVSSSSNYLALKKYIYDEATHKANAVEQLLNETWDATKRRITAGLNESVDIGKRGIIIRSVNHPDDILIAQAGVIAISNDGGQTFKNALTTEGLVAERIFGRMIIGQNLWIEDENGIVTIHGDLIEIKDAQGKSRVRLGQYEEGKYGLRVEQGGVEFVGGLPEEQMTDEFQNKISEISIRTEPDSIVSTVTSSTTFDNLLGEKADVTALGSLATKDELEETDANLKDYVDDSIRGIDFTPYVTSSDLAQSAEAFDFKFSKGGGVNMLKNSIGFGGFDPWIPDDEEFISTIQNPELAKLNFGSGFNFQNTDDFLSIYQTVDVTPNVEYTLSWIESVVTVDTGGHAFVIVYDGSDNSSPRLLESESSVPTEGFVEGKGSFRPSTDSVLVRLGFYRAEGTFTGIMMNIGEIALQWTLSPGEVYNANTRIDMNGVKVFGIDGDRYTEITPYNFSGYARVDGVMKEVFTLNDDVTEVERLRARSEILMNPVKIVPVIGGTYQGWAFIKDE